MVQSSTYLSACLSIHTWAIIVNRNIGKRYHNRWAATLAFWFHTWQDLGDISTGELHWSASILEFAISPCSWVNKESTSALLITGLITSTHRFGYNALRPWPTNTGNRGSLEARCFHLLLKVVECCWYSDYPHIHRGLRSMVDRVGRLRRVEAWKKSFHLCRWHLCQCLRRGLFSFGTLFPGQFNAGSLTAVTLQNAERCP